MKKYAFTMIELVFVIVVIGIITAVMIPRIDRDNVFEAAQQLESHIKYAQHLSMIDNAYDDSITYVAGNAGSAWWYKRWGVSFDTVVTRYRVKHSTDGGFSSASWVDINGTVGSALNDIVDSDSDLEAHFNIDSVNFAGGCAGAGVGSSIFFDNLGRPYFYINDAAQQISPEANILTSDCDISLVSGDKNATLTIRAETGYTSITSIN